MSTTIEFGNGHDPDGDHPWRGTDHVTVEIDEVTQGPNTKPTEMIVLRDAEDNEICGTPDDMRKVAIAILGMTDQVAETEPGRMIVSHDVPREAGASASPTLYDLYLRVGRGEFEPSEPSLGVPARVRETEGLRHSFAEAIRAAYGTRAVAHEHIFSSAERLARDRRLRILGRTWMSQERPCVEQPEKIHLMAWYEILNSAACAALGLTDWSYPCYPRAPEAEEVSTYGHSR